MFLLPEPPISFLGIFIGKSEMRMHETRPTIASRKLPIWLNLPRKNNGASLVSAMFGELISRKALPALVFTQILRKAASHPAWEVQICAY